MQNDAALLLLSSLEIGGSETKAIRLANALAGKGRPVKVAYLNGPETLLTQLDAAVEVKSLGRRGKLSVAAMARLARYVRGAEIGSILSMNLYPSLYAAAAVAFGGARSPTTLIAVNTTDHLGAKARMEMVLYERVLRAADRVIFGCKSQKEIWSENYGLDKEDCCVVYNGVDADRFRRGHCDAEVTALRGRLALRPDDFVLGTVGQLRPEKSQEQLLEVVARLRERVANLRGIIVGEGQMRAQLERRISELGLTGQVVLVGALEDVRPALELMDIFVLCSTAVETFSNAALEAMAMGRPVILSDIGGAREMVRDGVWGRVYPKGDVARLTEIVAALARDPHQRQAMGREARQAAESLFDFQEMVTQYEGLLWSKG